MTSTGRYRTELAGRSIEVGADGSGLTSTARLYVDGEQVDEQSASFEEIELAYDDLDVRVMCTWPGRVSWCALVLLDEAADEDDDKPAEYRIPLDPPAGTRAAKRAEFERSHPRLYAARHVAIAVGEVLAVVLGLSALLPALLPNIDLSWIPDIDLSWVPDVDLSWIRGLLSWIPDPFDWLSGVLPDISMPGWWDTVTGSTKYWLPILIAIGVAANETDKRRKARDA